MTEHRKAVKNRKRDLEAHHEHVHNYNQRAIAAGALLINAAATFKSPLRSEPTTHTNPQKLVEHGFHHLQHVKMGPDHGRSAALRRLHPIHLRTLPPAFR